MQALADSNTSGRWRVPCRVNKHGAALAAVLIVSAALEGGSARGQTFESLDGRHFRNGQRVRSAFSEVVAGASRSTVRIEANGMHVALGTVVHREGWIVTKASELSGDVTCRFKDGRELSSRLIAEDEGLDLALLKVDADDLMPVEWDESEELPLGAWLATPDLEEDPVTIGVVSVLPRRIPPKSGILGVTLEDSDQGPEVVQVVPNSGADEAGIEVGDVVAEFDGEPVTNRRGLIDRIRQRPAGEKVPLVVVRQGERLEVEAELGRGRRFRGPMGSDFQLRLDGATSRRSAGFDLALQHDSLLRPVDCGGPLVRLNGKAVGINVARAGRTESLAIPARTVQDAIRRMMEQRS
jgi:serine protease Do